MALADYLLFITLATAQVASPGPSTLYLVNNALLYGPPRAIGILTGDLAAIAVLAGCALLGVDAVLAANPGVFTAIKLAGAAYLVVLGVQQLRPAHTLPPGSPAQVGAEPFARLWGKSFAVGISNPKAILFFSSLLPQFIVPGRTGGGTLLGLIGLFVGIKLVVGSTYAALAPRMMQWLARPGANRWGKRLTGAVLVLFGVLLASQAFT